MSVLKLDDVQTWAPHPDAAPFTRRDGDTLTIEANGSRTCSGGWQLHYSGLEPNCYQVDFTVEHAGIANVCDALYATAFWGKIAPDQAKRTPLCQWEYLVQEKIDEQTLRFSGCLEAPAGAGSLTIRYTLRWSAGGRSVWRLPEIKAMGSSKAATHRVNICVVTGQQDGHAEPSTIQDNLAYYGSLCEAACAHKPDLIVLPETTLQWRVAGNPLDLAVPVSGPETAFFAQLARHHHVRIVLGMYERDEDAVHNSAVLISPQGEIDGIYRKVHLAVGGENESGILPGDTFPVYATEIGRIGCNICVDNSTPESARLIALAGADFLVLPIAGDNRADRWSIGKPIFNESRWRAIMRTRAMDNQLCLVVARNEAHGSCIIDRKGDILAWNEGDRPFIQATVALDDGYRAWNGGCLRDIQWRQRRPYLYQALVDSGALLDQPDTHLLIPLQEEAIDAQSLQHSLHHR